MAFYISYGNNFLFWNSALKQQLGKARRKSTPALDPSLFVEKAKPRLGNVGVTCGLFHSVLFAEQDVFVWGKGDAGRLGIDTEFNQYKPSVNNRIKRSKWGALEDCTTSLSRRLEMCIHGAFGALGHGSYERELIVGGPWKDRIVHVSARAAVTESGKQSSLFFLRNELYTWGRDEGEGRLGHGNPDIMDEGALSRPTKVQAIDVLIASVYCGGFITMALTKSGQLWSWGGNANHELGHGTRANNWKPKVVAALEDVTLVQVACGGFHAAALTQDGKVITWGYGGNGQLGHGTWKTGKSRLLSRPCIACGPAWTAAITENETRRSSPPCETCPLRKMGSMAALRTILVSTAVCTSSTPGLAWKPVSNPSQSTTTKPSSTGHMMSSGGVCR
ncbi:hypothetical protein SELMODRAFT_402231 [Selaginella moellendorffii]|uniref:Uncharacterized protein n=1 Tax=Selaginella moellendorffii TaxID=88036 RepID=D8QQ03_SELML|nr:hypothetical protein SELMODRAFT_402231 [Selaginella moellendorffii]